VFIDKDGTLIPNVPYNVDPAFILLMPGAREGLPRLVNAGYALVVVTNQSGVARGLYTVDDQARVEARIRQLLDQIAVPLTGYYFCPHLESGSLSAYAVRCDCRKPEPGLVRRAAAEHGLDVGRSWFVGDIVKDVEAGRRAGCRTILVDRYGEHLAGASPDQHPDFLAGTLADVADIILGTPGTPRETAATLAGGR
jgi:histidinol-phosphate phosphatase family protein